MIMTSEGVMMVANTILASTPLTSAMIRFCAVTSTEHAQQSRDPLNSRGGSPPASLPPSEYGGGTTTPDPTPVEDPGSESGCSLTVFSNVPFRDRLIFFVVSLVILSPSSQSQTVSRRGGCLKDLKDSERSEEKKMNILGEDVLCLKIPFLKSVSRLQKKIPTSIYWIMSDEMLSRI